MQRWKRLANKSNIYNLVKNSNLNTKLVTLSAKLELKATQCKIVKFQAFDSNYLWGRSYFEDMVPKII